MAFPTTPTLDNGTRADENPLSNGGIWTNPLWPGWANMKIASNQIAAVSDFASAYINTANFGDCEVWAVVQGSVADAQYLYWRISNPNAAGITGYRITILKGTSILQVHRIDSSGSLTQLGANYSVAINWGDTVGVEMIGDTITPYVAGVAQATRTDATYASGRIGLGSADTSPGLYFTSFGGGAVVTGTPTLFYVKA